MKNTVENEILSFFAPPLAARIREELRQEPDIYEVRLRKEQPIVIVSPRGTRVLRLDTAGNAASESCEVQGREFERIFEKLCHYSVYTYKENLNACYLTLPSGARVGVAGCAVVKSGKVTALKDISSLNFRIARQVETAAKEVLERLYLAGLPSTVVIGAPCSGKTTLLREMCRILATSFHGVCYTCALVDERAEIAAMQGGCPGFDVGVNCDVLSCFPKSEGILNALRTLSPDWIIADELGSGEEAKSILNGLNSGVKFLVSLHAASLEEAERKEQFRLLKSSGAVTAAVLLESGSQAGNVKEIRLL